MGDKMSRKLYEDHKELAGYTISTTKKGLKLDMWSRDWDTVDHIIYAKETVDFNRRTDFSKMWNPETTYAEHFVAWVSEWAGTPDQNKNIYRVVVA